MTKKGLVRVLVASAFAIGMAALATPASAQQGLLRGRVVDEAGKPVADVELTLDFVGDYTRQYKVKTDSKGEWVKAGMPSGQGTWTITAVKGDLTGMIRGVAVRIGEMSRTEDIVIKAGGAKNTEAAKLSQAEIEKRNKQQQLLEQLFTDANTAAEAGNYDESNAKLTEMAAQLPKCAACYAKMGDNYIKKSEADKDQADARQADLQKAEESYLKSLELDPNQPGPYNALASVYNSQKKFDDAAKMSAKANELAGAAGGPTGGSAESIYNQGIIFWNQGKIADAKTQFAKAIELDPKMADAQYWYGMACVNEGKLPDAKKPFEEYLKLAPTGQYAETAKAMLAMIK